MSRNIIFRTEVVTAFTNKRRWDCWPLNKSDSILPEFVRHLMHKKIPHSNYSDKKKVFKTIRSTTLLFHSRYDASANNMNNVRGLQAKARENCSHLQFGILMASHGKIYFYGRPTLLYPSRKYCRLHHHARNSIQSALFQAHTHIWSSNRFRLWKATAGEKHLLTVWFVGKYPVSLR
jgi:phosphoribosyl-AMP cyclohydrolase